MTESERNLCWQLVTRPDGTAGISKDEFVARFPSAVKNGRLALRLLEEAERARNGKDLQSAMIIGFTFGFGPEHVKILCRLVDAKWHQSHEDVVSALDDLRTCEAVDALFGATQWIPEYLDYDGARALAVKAIWGLGNLPGEHASARLKTLVQSNDSILRSAAFEQLERRGEAPGSE